MIPQEDMSLVVHDVVKAFKSLSIPYALGGSMASSLLGKPRLTADADFTAEPFPGREAAFAKCFGPDYYLHIPAIEHANRRRSSFNIIHTASGFKADVFIAKERPFDREVMGRRRLYEIEGEPQESITLVSPEDIILLKLEWYRIGQEVSEKQWSDVLGVLQVKAGQLDEAYLDRWAASLGVSDLLARARQQASASLD